MNIVEFIKNKNSNLERNKYFGFSNNELENEEDIEENEVSELHMHKILYFIYGGFYKNFKKELFIPEFHAWRFGPVDINYRRFAKNGDKLSKNYEFNFDDLTHDEQQYLEELTEKLLVSSPWFLVDFSHLTSSWKNHYFENDKSISNDYIPNTEIQQAFEDIEI